MCTHWAKKQDAYQVVALPAFVFSSLWVCKDKLRSLETLWGKQVEWLKNLMIHF